MSSATLDRTQGHDGRDARAGTGPSAPDPAAPRRGSRGGLEIAVVLLVVAASLSLGRVFVGPGFLRPVLAAALLSLGVTSGTRRLGAGPLLSLLATAGGWIVFVAVAFVPDTLVALVVPTRETLSALADLWVRGLDLVRLRPAPAFPEPGLMLLAVTGVWWVAHAVEVLVFRLAAPVRAIAMALVLWVVPLALAPQGDGAGEWRWSVPFLAAAAVVLLASSGTDTARWGVAVDPRTDPSAPRRRRLDRLAPAGAIVAVVAIGAALVIAPRLPGAEDPPWWQLRGSGGTTLTTNPIVNLRSNLVATDSGPVLRVRTPRPVYLRTTALDVYSDDEEWTSAGIRGSEVPPLVPFEVPIGASERFWIDVEVVDLPGAVLVPSPYQAEALAGPAAERFRYDRRTATFTLEEGSTLGAGDAYGVFAAIPNPPAEALESTPVSDPSGELTALPQDVPPEVALLAREIVAGAGATSPFAQALAIQEELRTWEYSLDPPQGHSGEAMRTFLENRIGYCEQFAGTMAVMLRTLGIPARVAVGFSPGSLADPTAGEYVVTNANAHAWVEVLFPGLGWIAFEPTPRSDGNVLVPTPANLAPSQTVADAAPETSVSPEAGDIPAGDANPQLDPLEPQEEAQAEPGGTGGQDESGPSTVVVALLVAALAAAAAAVVVRRGRAAPAVAAGERVDAALGSVVRVARGLGVAPGTAETEREHLVRLAGDAPDGAALATAVGRARYALDVPDTVADDAERAASSLRERLLGGRSRLGRRLVLVRGSLRGLLTPRRRR